MFVSGPVCSLLSEWIEYGSSLAQEGSHGINRFAGHDITQMWTFFKKRKKKKTIII